MTAKTQKILVWAITAILLVALIIFIFVQNKANKEATPFENSTIAMGTVIHQSVYADKEDASKSAVTGIIKVISDLEARDFSWRIEGSDIYNVNTLGKYEVSDTTADCISTCQELSQNCNGVFDISVGKLSTLWNIGTEDARLPAQSEINDAMNFIDYKKITQNKNEIQIAEGQKLDLGSVGKGLACDKAREYLKGTDVNGAVISVGGSILLYGSNPTSKDNTWTVGIRNPRGDANDYAIILNVADCCVSTSGDYEKVLTVDGKTYHHILDPRTGYPAESGLTSVTIVSDSGVLTDALSTACFVMGYSEDTLSLLQKYNAEAVFITKDGKVYATDGIKSSTKIINEDFTWGK